MTGYSYNTMPLDEDEPVFTVTDGPRQVKERLLRLLEEPEFAGEEEQTIESQETTRDLRELITTLYEEMRPQLYNYLTGTLRIDGDQAKEIIQEAFLRLTACLADGGQIKNPHGWVVRVARYITMDIYRKQDHERPDGDALQEAFHPDLADPALNQEERLLAEEKIRCLNKALEQMNSHQRICFLMRSQGFRYKDIGEAMNFSEQRAAAIVKIVTGRLAVLCG